MKSHLNNKAISMVNRNHELEIDFYKANQKYPFDVSQLDKIEINSSENLTKSAESLANPPSENENTNDDNE